MPRTTQERPGPIPPELREYIEEYEKIVARLTDPQDPATEQGIAGGYLDLYHTVRQSRRPVPAEELQVEHLGEVQSRFVAICREYTANTPSHYAPGYYSPNHRYHWGRDEKYVSIYGPFIYKSQDVISPPGAHLLIEAYGLLDGQQKPWEDVARDLKGRFAIKLSFSEHGYGALQELRRNSRFHLHPMLPNPGIKTPVSAAKP